MRSWFLRDCLWRVFNCGARIMGSGDLMNVTLTGGAPWGFRLFGGESFPIEVAKVTACKLGFFFTNKMSCAWNCSMLLYVFVDICYTSISCIQSCIFSKNLGSTSLRIRCCHSSVLWPNAVTLVQAWQLSHVIKQKNCIVRCIYRYNASQTTLHNSEVVLCHLWDDW